MMQPYGVALLGALAGVAQAYLLRAAVRKGWDPFGAVLRLALVGAVLYVAAWQGYLPAGAAGYVSAFGVSVVVGAKSLTNSFR